jgi:ribosomal protein L30E
MKKNVIYICIGICIGFVVGFLSTVVIGQKETIQNVDSEKNHVVALEPFEASDSLNIKDMPVLKFAKTKYDFGTVRQGTIVNIVFEFQNTGDVPLVIYKADVSCGCLSAEYSKDPTMPGHQGVFKVKIDTKGLSGIFNKTLFVKSNATENIILMRIMGQIK